MPLQTGSRVGPYEVLCLIGAGGMGEVYKARDTRLRRDVAIKVLPAKLSLDADRLTRFELEARAASALNHPNIVTIYDVGSSDSVPYIAMELVEGDSLRILLRDEALPVKRLLQIATQLADGLAKAHGSGIVHRDIKPDNVIVTPDSLVKILDFGLAKLTQPGSSGSAALQTTGITGATEPGSVMGTVGYMSPEQAAGKSADYRSDQFSLGAILYEMATGKRAFARGSAAETLAAIIRDEPEPITALNVKIPAPVRWLIERCLAKDPRYRYASTDDLARELATIRDHVAETVTAAENLRELPEPGPLPRWFLTPLVGALLFVVVGVATWYVWTLTRDRWQNPLAGARFARLTDWEGSELDAAISADGKFVVFLADRDGSFEAFVNQVGTDEFVKLTRGQFPELLHEQVRSVGFSADGARVWLGVREMDPDGGNIRGGVWLAPTMGGAPRPFITPRFLGASATPRYGPGAMLAVWSADGSRILSHEYGPGDAIFTTDRNGGDRRRVFIDQPGSHCHFPIWSPDGRFIYFVRGTPTVNAMDIWRIPSLGGEPERVTYHNSRVAYPTFVDQRTLLYAAASEDGSGSALYAVETERGIDRRVSFGVEEYISVSASTDGRRLVATVANPIRNLWTVPIRAETVDESAVSRFPLSTQRAAAPRFGPGFLVYLSSRSGADGLWRYKDGSAVELWKPSDGFLTSAPAISPDGGQICFSIRKQGRSYLHVIGADGTNVRSVAPSLDIRDSASWSPDGKWILAAVNDGAGRQPLFKIPVDGGAAVRMAEGKPIFNPLWSPNGRLIVYSESVWGNMYHVKAITPEGKPYPLPELWIRSEGDHYRFLPDGKALVFIQGQFRRHNFSLLDLSTGAFRKLTNLRPGYAIRGFDIAPDGQEIVFDRVRENSDIVLIDLPPR